MALADSTARKLALEPAPNFRSVPHNIEAEQQLLGAVLINNEAFDAVSDFLQPRHFFVPVHQLIFDVMGQFVRMNKNATPTTIKTFLPDELKVDGRSAAEYLAHLAAEATTIINAADFGRTIYDLSLRRDL
ncbi:MAG: DnaB-like helicase N-terminal domain-containing protein, partial [Pseudolabrys sp.]